MLFYESVSKGVCGCFMDKHSDNEFWKTGGIGRYHGLYNFLSLAETNAKYTKSSADSWLLYELIETNCELMIRRRWSIRHRRISCRYGFKSVWRYCKISRLFRSYKPVFLYRMPTIFTSESTKAIWRKNILICCYT